MVPVIAAIPGSEVTEYSPVEWGRERREYGTWEGKLPYQPKAREGTEWPPHLALARLNLQDEAAVVQFCSLYGLLGLRYIPKWKNRVPFLANERPVKSIFGTLSGWYNYPAPEPKPPNWHHVQTFCEPLDLFREAAQEYQEACCLIEKVREAPPEKAQSFAFDAENTMIGYLGGCTPRPIFQNGRWLLGYQFRSLLEACYFRLLLDLTEGASGFRRCGNPKCNRFFLARYEKDTYCCKLCRKQATVDRTAIREVKRWLKEKRKAGEITKEEWQVAGKRADELYKKLKDIETLKEAVEASIKNAPNHTRQPLPQPD
jgi:hypothetical protein